jgi:hypothetical protein
MKTDTRAPRAAQGEKHQVGADVAVSAEKAQIGVRVVANKRLNQFESWCVVRAWNKKGFPKRKRWSILRFIADHAWLAVSGAGDREASVRRHLYQHAPGLGEAEIAGIVDGATNARLWPSYHCGELLGISAAAGEKHRLTHLGANDDPDLVKRKRYAAARRKERDRLRKEAERRAAGAKPRAEYEATSASQTKPWLAAGYKTRRTWERHRKRDAEVVASVSTNNLEQSYKRTDLRHDTGAVDMRTDLCNSTDAGERPAPQASGRVHEPGITFAEGAPTLEASAPIDTGIDWTIWNPLPHKPVPSLVIDQHGNVIELPPDPDPIGAKTYHRRPSNYERVKAAMAQAGGAL